MELLIGFLLFAALVAYGATTKGKNPAFWFFLAILISPLLAGIILLISPDESQDKSHPRTNKFQKLREQRRLRQEREEQKQLEADQRAERERSQQLHVALLSQLAGSRVPVSAPEEPLDLPPPLPDEVPIAGWYVSIDGQKTGPLEIGGLARLAQKGKINNETLIWRRGYPGWTLLKTEKRLILAIQDHSRKLI